MDSREIILQVNHLKQYYENSSKYLVKAVDDVTFSLIKREIFGIAGASGSGKTTLARCILHMQTPTSGEVYFHNECISSKPVYRKHRKSICSNIQMIFQDTAASLNPRMTVENLIIEPLRIQRWSIKPSQRKKLAMDVLSMVGLEDRYLDYYPGELSGGQKQRVCIARAVILKPEIIVADEAVASLDASIQAQIVNLFLRLQKELGFTFLFISHDLGMVRYISDRVGIMHNGHLIEVGDTEYVFTNPKEEYTKKLMEAIPEEVYHECR